MALVKKLLNADPKLVQQVNKKGLSPLHAAVRGDKIDIIRILLDGKADVNARAEDDLTPLFFAQRTEIAELLLSRGADVNASTKKERLTLLHNAVRNGDLEFVALLLANGADVDGGWTGKEVRPSSSPLWFAAHEGKVDAGRLLLAKGAKVDATQFDSNGMVLYEAVEQGHTAFVRLLLRKGADPNRGHALHRALQIGKPEMIQLFVDKGADFTRPELLIYAAASGKKAIVELLLAKGADVNQIDRYDTNALWLAARDGHADIVALLLDKNADAGIALKDGTTPLHVAATKEIAARLLQRGARLNAATKDGLTPIAAAVYRGDKAVAVFPDSKEPTHNVDTLVALGHELVLRRLLKIEPLPKVKHKAAYPPLHLAARFGQAKTAQVLLKHGVDVNATRSTGILGYRHDAPEGSEAALHLAAQHGQLAMVELLIEAKATVNDTMTDLQHTGDNFTPLLLAFDSGHVEVVKRLAKANGLPRIDGAQNAAALLPRAVKNRHPAMVKLLLDEGAPLDAKLAPNDTTVLHLAAGTGDLELVKWLVGKKFNVNTPDQHGWTPMLRAVEHGHLAVVEYLLACGADVKIGLPLHAAASGGHVPIVKLLVDKGVNLDVFNDNPFNQRTALGYAATAGHLDVMKLLRAKGASVSKDVGLLHQAAFHGKREVAGFLVDHGVSVEEFLPDGYQMYYGWVQPRQLSMVAFFVEKDPAKLKGKYFDHVIAEINGKKPFAIVGGRPLQAAVAGQRHAVAALLLDKGASSKVLFPNGATPLHLAASLGDVKMAALLLTHGADVNARDGQGRTPLQVAAEYEEAEVAALFKKHGS